MPQRRAVESTSWREPALKQWLCLTVVYDNFVIFPLRANSFLDHDSTSYVYTVGVLDMRTTTLERLSLALAVAMALGPLAALSLGSL